MRTRRKFGEMIRFVINPIDRTEVWPMAVFYIPDFATPAAYRMSTETIEAPRSVVLCEICWPGAIFCISSERKSDSHELCTAKLKKFMSQNPESSKVTKFGYEIKSDA